MVFIPKQREDILQDEIDWAIAKTSKISDFNEGSVNFAILDAVALVVEQAYFDTLLGWVAAMRYALQSTLSFTRKTGTKSTGNVVFSRSTPAQSDIIIIIGTIIATADGKRFLTTQIGTIPTGNTDSGNVSVESEEVGKDKNVSANTIIQLVSIPVGVDAVNNPALTANGTDIESNEAYDIRFQEYLGGLTKTTYIGVQAGAKTVNGVGTALLVETNQKGILNLYIDDGSGSASQSLIDQVIDVIDKNGLDSEYIVAGMAIRYLPVTKVDISPVATVYYDRGEDETTLKAKIKVDLSAYINALAIGEDVIVEQLEKVIMNVPGVRDVNLTTPVSNVLIAKSLGEIAKYLTSTITMALYTDVD